MSNALVLLTVLSFYLTALGQSNTSQYEKTIVRYLDLAEQPEDLEVLSKTFPNDIALERHFDSVPTINPLNPKNQKRVSSRFGRRFHPIDSIMKPHLGIDISANAGTPVHAAASGTVTKVVASNYGYGNQVYIEHAYGFSTRYAHLYTYIVQKGSTVKKGEIIGFVGNTGKSTANHIHFEIKKHDKHLDPLPFITTLK